MTAVVSLVLLGRGDAPDVGTAHTSTSDSEATRALDLAARAATGDPTATRELLMLVSPAVVRSVRLVLGAKSRRVRAKVTPRCDWL